MPESTKLPLMARLAKVHLSQKRRLQAKLKPHGITLKQMYVLRQLDRRGPLNPSVIAEELYCDRPTATVIISNLEKKAWVRRKADPESKRRVLIELSAKGQKKLEKVQNLLSPAAFNPLDALTPREQQTLEKLLIKIQKYQQESNS